jgi:hypothetical protein
VLVFDYDVIEVVTNLQRAKSYETPTTVLEISYQLNCCFSQVSYGSRPHRLVSAKEDNAELR